MSNRLPFVALAVACVIAAGAGGYLATRQNAVPTPAAAQGAPVPASTVAAVPAATQAPPAPVQETEAVVGDTTSKAGPEPSASPAPSDMTKTAKRRPDAAGSRAARSTTSVARREQAPTLTSTWPSSQAPAPAQAPAVPVPPIDPVARPDDHVTQEPVRPPEPPKPTFEELVIARDSVIGLQTENRIASDTAHVEDRVDARVTRDVRVGNRIAIPAGSRVIGSVTQVDRGGKFKEQARLGIRFHTIMLADGTRLPISTETIVRLGESPANGSAAKIGGGTVGGAILGAILGGAKGAAIGATAGAGAGTAAVTAGDRSTVVLPPGTPLTPRILSPVTVTIER